MTYDLLEKHRATIFNCQVCSVCQRGPWNPYPPKGPTSDRLCPEYEMYRTLTHSALGRIQAARWMLEGAYEPNADFMKVSYDCLLCGACSTVGCVVDKDHVPLFRDLRADLVNAGMAPPEPFRKTAAAITGEGNRFGRPQSDRGKWAEGLNVPAEAELAYFAGCVASYRAPQLARATAQLLQQSDTPFTILGQSESCCGNPLISTGLMDQFEAVARSNIDALKERGVKRVVTSCACGYRTLKFDYPQLPGGTDFEVVHITELLAQYIEEARLKPHIPFEATVAYQDPCHLVRMGGRIVRQPRTVIDAIPGIERVEMEGNVKDTQCCGRFPVELPDLSRLTGTNRLKDAQAAGAQTIITACAFCHWNLNRSARSLDSDMNVMDITELVAQAIA